MYRLAKARERNPRDLDQVKYIKDEDGKVLVEEAHIRRRGKAYFHKLLNKERVTNIVLGVIENSESEILITVGVLRLKRLRVLCVR